LRPQRNKPNFLVKANSMTRDNAYMLMSVAGDVEVPELVGRNKEGHVALRKSLLTPR
jgi:acetamidase/formamidase